MCYQRSNNWKRQVAKRNSAHKLSWLTQLEIFYGQFPILLETSPLFKHRFLLLSTYEIH